MLPFIRWRKMWRDFIDKRYWRLVFDVLKLSTLRSCQRNLAAMMLMGMFLDILSVCFPDNGKEERCMMNISA